MPDTDLARIAPLPPEQKWQALQQQKTGYSPSTYSPVRQVEGDILNAQSRLLGPIEDIDFSAIKATIHRSAKSPEEEEMNVEVARLYYDFLRQGNFRAVQADFGRFGIRVGYSVAYWSSAVLIYEGQLLIPCADYRRTRGFTLAARRFAASVMHESIRLQRPTEFGKAKLAVFQFPHPSATEKRRAVMRIVDDGDLYSAEELAKMIAETYEMWAAVLAERTDRARRAATATGSGFL